MAQNSYGWMSPDYAQPQYSTDMGMNRGRFGGMSQTGSNMPKLPVADQMYRGGQQQGYSQMDGYDIDPGYSRPTGPSGMRQASMGMPGQQYSGPPMMTSGMGVNGPPGNGQSSPGYQVPAAPQWDYNPQQGMNNPFLDQFNQTSQDSEYNRPGYYRDDKNRAAMDAYVNSYITPLMNANLANRTQNFNEQQAYQNYLEQQRVNTGQMDLAYRGNAREDLALQYGQQNNVRDFGEAQRQFNLQQGLAQQQQDTDAKYKAGLISAQEYANETGRIQAQNDYALGQGNLAATNQKNAWDYALGQGANQNQANQIANEYNLGKMNANIQTQKNSNDYALGQGNLAATNQKNAWDYALGQGNLAAANQKNAWDYALGQGALQNQNYANATGRMDVQNQFLLGQGNLANQAFANQAQAARFQGQTQNEAYQGQTGRMQVQNDYALGQGSLANQAFANQAQAARFQGQTANEAAANQTALQNVLNQYSLGQGQLGLGNRQLDVQSAYQQQQLAQEAALTREKYKNDLQQAQIAATGRIVGPNLRAARSWY